MNSSTIFSMLGIVGLGVLIYEFVSGYRRARRHLKRDIYVFDDDPLVTQTNLGAINENDGVAGQNTSHPVAR